MALSIAGTPTTAFSTVDPTSTINVNKPTSTANGEWLVLCGSSSPAVTWNVPTGFSAVATSATTGGRSLAVWVRLVDGTEGASFTVSHNTASATSLAAACFRVATDVSGGGITVDVLGTTDSAGASNATVTFSNLNVVAGALVLRFASANLTSGTTMTMTPPASNTEIVDNNTTAATGARTHLAISWRLFASAGLTGASTGTLSSSRPWQAVSISLKETGTSYHPYLDRRRRTSAVWL